MFEHAPQPRIKLNACDYAHVPSMCRVFEVYMLPPPEPDTYARRFPHFVLLCAANACRAVRNCLDVRNPNFNYKVCVVHHDAALSSGGTRSMRMSRVLAIW